MQSEEFGSYHKFLNELRNIFDREENDNDAIEYIYSALKGEVDAGDISDLIHDRYVVEKIKDGLFLESQKLREENKKKLDLAQSRLEAQFEQRVQNEVELQGIYKVVKDKFISDKSFVEYALRQIQQDVKDSKENEIYPFLYQMTIDCCDKNKIIEFLIFEYGDELIEEYRQEIKSILLERHSKEILSEIKKEMSKNSNFIEGLKDEIKQEIIKKMFG